MTFEISAPETWQICLFHSVPALAITSTKRFGLKTLLAFKTTPSRVRMCQYDGRRKEMTDCLIYLDDRNTSFQGWPGRLPCCKASATHSGRIYCPTHSPQYSKALPSYLSATLPLPAQNVASQIIPRYHVPPVSASM